MPLDSKILTQISEYMKTSSGHEISSVKVVNTYIGQMISHDIVPPTSKKRFSRNVTPILNLDSIYGSDPFYSFEIFPQRTGFLNKDGFFVHREIPEGGFDVERITKKLGEQDVHLPIIPEPRNSDNLIILQLHIFWQKIHNLLLQRKFVLTALQARRITTLLFQLVVIEDFLKEILDTQVYEKLFVENKEYLDFFSDEIPDYFKFASFRFGHSMVRQKYVINEHEPNGVKLQELFARNLKLEAHEVIDWVRFNSAKASSIDTRITMPLGSVPGRLGRVMQNVPLFNLLAAKENNLESGDKFIDKLLSQDNGDQIIEELGVSKLIDLHDPGLKNIPGLTIQNLPLWPYLLLESKVKRNGAMLGPLGSLLNGEVIRRAIIQSEFSVYEKGRYNWESVLSGIGRFGEVLRERRESSNNGKSLFDILVELINEWEREND